MRKIKLFKRILAATVSAVLVGNVLCVQATELPEGDAITESVMETEDVTEDEIESEITIEEAEDNEQDTEKDAEGIDVILENIDVKAEDGSALEYVVEEESVTGDMEISFPAGKSTEMATNFENETFDVSLTGNEVSLYGDSGIRTIDAEDKAGRDSALYHGSVSGYLTESGAYELYSVNLSAGDYLQARLTVPNNTSINYALVLYDSALNVIKMSHYIPYLNGGATLEESIGYLPTSDEVVYMGIFSLVGGSTTEAYTLDFSILTNYPELSDTGEPNENVQEAATLNLGSSGATVSGMINSPVDNDWYSFTVIDSPQYNKMRLNLTSTSSVNGCKLEIYRNLTEDYFTMQLGGSGTGEGEVDLPAGTYYIRVMSTNTFSNFNPLELPSYSLSVVPVSRVDGIVITTYEGIKVTEGSYHEGYSCRIWDLEGTEPTFVNVIGLAYYTDSMGNKTGAANVKVKGTVVNTSYELSDEPELSTTYGSAITREDGFFFIRVYLNKSLGYRHYSGDSYDYMEVEVCPQYNTQKKATGFFYLLHSYIKL